MARVLPGCVAMLLLAGCVMQPVAGPQDEPTRLSVQAGDTLRVLTRDGQRRSVKVEHLDASGIVADGKRIEYADMVFVERLQTSGREAGAVTGVMVLEIIGAAVVAVGTAPGNF